MRKNLTGTLTAASLAALAIGVAACGSDDDTATAGGTAGGTVNAAGSTFAAPVYQQWGSTLKGQGVTLNYQAIGSGGGVAALSAGTAEFAGNDSALTGEDRATFEKGDVVQIPVFFGAITVSYNVDGVDTGLKLDGQTIADIFLGRITAWNDPAIARLNGGVDLPDTKITVVHRSDESGTTKGFTTFLAAYSKQWESEVGVDKTVKWPTGTGAKGNDGVAAGVKQNDGAIGYVEQAYALQNDFTTADVKNRAGNFVEPSLESTSAAGDGLDVPEDLGISSIDAPADHAYPIASQTFIDVYGDVCKAGMKEGDANALGSFLTYGLGEGQASLGELYYAKLPSSLLGQARKAASSITCNGSPLTGA